VKSRVIVIVTILSFFLVIGLTAQVSDNRTASIIPQESPTLEKDSIAFATINIPHNLFFDPAGFTGSGTEGDPYILDGEVIDVPNGLTGIRIDGTTAHFIIRNCVINSSSGGAFGIDLQDLSNGTIENCTIYGVDDGIQIQNSYDVNITANTIYDCGMNGIASWSTSKVLISQNTISDIGYKALILDNSHNVTVSDNSILRTNLDGSFSGPCGIDSDDSDNLTILSNEIRSTNKGYGMDIDSAANLVVDNNLVWEATHGMDIRNAPSVIVSNNNISCIQDNGLFIGTLSFPHVFGNRIYHGITSGSDGMNLQGCSSGLFEDNDVFKFIYGINVFSNSGNNTFSENNLGWAGLYNGRDTRSTNPKNNWTSNQFDDFSSNPYYISGTGGANDSSASLLSDTTAPTIDSPADIVMNDVDTNKWVTWQANDRFPGDYLFYINYTYESTHAWCNSSISISLDGLAVGVYDYTVAAYDVTASNNAQDTVRITVLDTQPPVFTSATTNYTIEYSERVWTNITATDDTPGIKRAWADDSELLAWNDPWTSPLTLDWDHVFPSKGEHNYTIMLTDKAGNYATHTCIVTVEDTTAPTAPDFPSDFSAETGQVTWVNFTLYNPYHDNYEIWLDDTIDVSTFYGDGQYISYKLNYSSPGEHNVTLVAWDDDVNTMKATCFVTYVDTTGPSITGPVDFPLEAGESPITSWSWTELNPENYTIFENNTQATFSTTFSGDIQHTLDGLTPGVWNITLIIYDSTGHFETDELWVTVVDTTAPTLAGDANLNVEFDDTIQINWTVANIDPWDQDGSWQVYVNGTEETSGVWDSSQVSYQLAPVIAVYNVTVVVTDAYGNSVTYTTWVTCQDTIPPLLSGDDDLEITVGPIITLNWTCSDLDPASYVLLRNGIITLDHLNWYGDDISYQVSLGVGVYNFTLIVFDGSGNSVSDTVIVTVNEETTTTTTTTTTTSTTTTTTTTDDGGLMLILGIAGVGGAIVVIIVVLVLKSKK